jgi:hypothetical protein
MNTTNKNERTLENNKKAKANKSLKRIVENFRESYSVRDLDC